MFQHSFENFGKWRHSILTNINTRNGLLTLGIFVGYALVGIAGYLNFPPAWSYLPESQRNPGSCSALADCTNPDVVRGTMFFLPLALIMFMRSGDNKWGYYLKGTKKQIGSIVAAIGLIGGGSSLIEIFTAMYRSNVQLAIAGSLSLSSIPLLNWIVKRTQFVDSSTPFALGPAEFGFFGFVYVTFVPLSSSFFFGSIYNVALIDFTLLLVGSPVFKHLLKTHAESTRRTRDSEEALEISYGL